MKKLSFLMLCVLLSVLRAEAATKLAGLVVNGSAGDRAAPNATVQMLRVNQEGASQTLATVKTDAQGRFTTKPLDIHTNDLIFARIDWGGYPYVAAAFDGAGRTGAPIDSANLRLHVYDTSEEAPPGMTFVAHHIALKDDGDNLKCTERIVVENPSNKTFIGLGQERITLGLSLPKGAKNVEIDHEITDAKLVKIGPKPIYAVSKPITPTMAGGPVGNAIIVHYTLPWSKRVDLSRQLLYPEKFFFVVREEADRDKIVVDAPQLGKDEVQPIPIEGQMQNRLVKLIGAPQSEQPVLQAGQKMQIFVSRPTPPLVWGFVGLTGLLCVFVPGIMLWGRKKPRSIEYSNVSAKGTASVLKSAEPLGKASVYSVIHSPGSTSDGVAGEAPESGKAAQIIEKLAALDDDWEAGRIDAQSYQTQRAQWKQQVVQLMKSAEASKN
ncbi:MAG TPA: hypothetical protein VM821_00625 [Abditibacteriaceae bacterium]|jgi:hypothetical protein|nr:hypothetical protein [Abditibacteriaceae bacterium]